jgi:ABC-type multidrug transport system fused ATPase/permease subunit
MIFDVIKSLLSLLSYKERHQALWILFSITLTALVDVMGIASLFPFITVVSNSDLIDTNFFLRKVYFLMNFNNKEDFLIFLGFAVFLIFIFAQTLKIVIIHLQLKFSLMREFTISRGLLINYLQRNYDWYLSVNTSNLSSKLLSEVNQIVYQAILPLLVLISNAIVSVFIFILLLLVDPMLALIIFSVLSFSYFTIYQLVKKYINRWGKERHESNLKRFRVVSDVFSVIKEVKLYSLESFYNAQYEIPALKYAKHQASSQSVAQMPRYILEMIAFGGMFLVVLYAITINNGLIGALPILALYAFAGYRLMPAMQLIYVSWTQIKYIAPSLFDISKDFISPVGHKELVKFNDKKSTSLSKKISIESLTFSYPGAQSEAIVNVNFIIRANNTVGIVGKSGAGKTTLIDIMMGLYFPNSGKIIVDGVPVDRNNIDSWRSNIGYVPQQIYLLDDTIANNIALGEEANKIDQSNIEAAARTANLHDFIMTLPDGYGTLVGDRGVKLSGGQRQRIGIARALYRKPQILFLDEATSALDNLTESAVIEAVHNLSHKLTIVLVAHRLSTVKSCDQILLMDSGKIVDSGTYQELFKKNSSFKLMVEREN